MPILTDRMVRVTIEVMDEPKDRMVLQRELTWFIDYSVIENELTVDFSYIRFDGLVIRVPISAKELATYFRQSAEAV